MMKKDLIHQIGSLIDHCLQENELVGKIMTEFVALRPKTYFYLMEDGENKKKSKAMCNKKSA